ncbi:hypothetical protein [Kosakonia cowanii]|uniref:hypothetical protein n=1 Tax=Kosakonia cowanii TaxID=208223 RepID=UPI001E35C27A|nr:hypothetical protein [Kosakonia cowanii]
MILDEGIVPAVQANLLYNPMQVMNGWSEEEIKQVVTKYMSKKPTIIERVILARLLLKQRKHIQGELKKLSAELEKCF